MEDKSNTSMYTLPEGSIFRCRLHPHFPRHCHPYARKSASQAVLSIECRLPFMRLAHQQLTALRVWYKRGLPGGCKHDVLHGRDARVYGHTTTAMHDNEYTPPPSPRNATQQLPASPRVAPGPRRRRGAVEVKGAWLQHSLGWTR